MDKLARRTALRILWVMVVFLIGLGIGMANPSTGRQMIPASNCDFIHWQNDDAHGMHARIPFDANRDNKIDCRNEVK